LLHAISATHLGSCCKNKVTVSLTYPLRAILPAFHVATALAPRARRGFFVLLTTTCEPVAAISLLRTRHKVASYPFFSWHLSFPSSLCQSLQFPCSNHETEEVCFFSCRHSEELLVSFFFSSHLFTLAYKFFAINTLLFLAVSNSLPLSWSPMSPIPLSPPQMQAGCVSLFPSRPRSRSLLPNTRKRVIGSFLIINIKARIMIMSANCVGEFAFKAPYFHSFMPPPPCPSLAPNT
jgi:hypothetical protein